MGSPACMWCLAPFHLARKRGSERRFCSSRCRVEFHTAARRWAESQLAAGKVTIARLKKAPSESVHASQSEKQAPAYRRPRQPRPHCAACGRFSKSSGQ
jgi:hypothetical protein